MRYAYFYNLRKELKKVEHLEGELFEVVTLKDQLKLKRIIAEETKVTPIGAVLVCYQGGKK